MSSGRADSRIEAGDGRTLLPLMTTTSKTEPSLPIFHAEINSSLHRRKSCDKNYYFCQLLTVADRPQSTKINSRSGNTIVNESLRIGLIIASGKPYQFGEMSFINQ